jgi:hypothetical protein
LAFSLSNLSRLVPFHGDILLMMNKVMFLCNVLNKMCPAQNPGEQNFDPSADRMRNSAIRPLDWGIRLGESLWILNCRHPLSQKTGIKQNLNIAREHEMDN